MSGLSNHFLENFLLPKCENFIGVYPVDRVPLNLWGRCCSAIINLSKADHPGSHFIAIYIDRDNVLWYFDSFALLPPIYNSHLFDFLKKWIRCGKIKCVLSRPIQDFDSLFCGWHTAAFCLFVNFYPNCDPPLFHTLFDGNTLRRNERIVSHIVKILSKKKSSLQRVKITPQRVKITPTR